MRVEFLIGLVTVMGLARALCHFPTVELGSPCLYYPSNRPGASIGSADFEGYLYEMKVITLFLMATVIMIDIYLANRDSVKRPEIYYGVAALMLFAALLLAGGIA